MVFNSLEYFLFLPAIWLFHYFLGQRFRWLFLLVASYLFYASLNAPYLLGVITLVTLVTYGFGLWIHKAEGDKRKKQLLWSGIASNTLILVTLKYLPLLTDFFAFLESPIISHDSVLLVTIGVSFYIFQAISYLNDIYLEIEVPEQHLGYFALYLAFFPKLLQGPIERAGNLLPQLKQKYEFNYDNMRFGLLLFTWGLFKKVVLADRLGLYVDTVYDDVHSYQGLSLILATYAFAFELYFSFSGYTDMALGTARLFNINLTNNFNKPYFSTSVAQFWRRWHITFSRWIFDYIFNPLQMQWRNGKNWGTAAALMVTFFVSGLWHGASWTFVAWGLLHGLYLACSVFYRPYQKIIHKALKLEKTKLLKFWQIFVTFNLVCFSWIFFRANSTSDAVYIVKNAFNILGNYKIFVEEGAREFIIKVMVLGVHSAHFAVVFTSALIVLFLNGNRIYGISEKKYYARWSMYILIVFLTISFWKSNESFIYFNF